MQRLAVGDHPVEAGLRPEKSVQALKESIDRGYVHIKFTNTRGGTELGVRLAHDDIDLSQADFDNQTGTVHLVGGLTLDYVKQREQFGQQISSFQVIQHRLVDMFVQQELSRNTVAQAIAVFDETLDHDKRASAVSAAKARASDAGLLITRQAVQLYGGIGFTDECDIGLYLKRALVLAAWLGNSSVHRERFGRFAESTSAASP